MKKLYFVIALLIFTSMIITACGSGCEAGDTEEQCRERSPLEQPISEADQASDEAIKTLNQQIDADTAARDLAIRQNDANQQIFIQELNAKIDADTKLRDAAIQQYAAEQDKKIGEINDSYTNWVTNFVTTIFGSP